ncbi:MAG TPA: polysaccharide ABC transporter ATP-binding protein [Bacteroidales bacterium]|nr:polysaccharide ABC transporter ATP-binding protein [Bacteroidales bacterium]
MSETVIKVENLSKQYRLGLVGVTTISEDIKRYWAKIQGKEDPTLKIGQVNTLNKIQNSEFRIQNYVWALKDINFEVKQGEVLGIIGKNGAGKSTLLKILSKVTAPSTGNIKIKGRIASLLEVGTGFHAELTGRENIFLNGAILGMTKAEIKSKLDEIIDFSGVERYIDTPVKRYSSGMYVRLAFAVAAHLESEILILDEVLAIGDAEFQKKCLGKMGDVAKGGRTVLFVSHNLTAVSSLCEKGIYLKNGTINFYGTIQEVVPKYLNSERAIKSKMSWFGNNCPGDNIAELRAVVLINEKYKEIVSVDISERIGIECTYFVKKGGNARIPNIHIYTLKGECAFVCVEEESEKLYNSGMFKTILWIPENLLNVNTYLVKVALTTFTPFHVHYEVDTIIFETHENIYNRNHTYNQVIPGTVRPILKWETNIVLA